MSALIFPNDLLLLLSNRLIIATLSVSKSKLFQLTPAHKPQTIITAKYNIKSLIHWETFSAAVSNYFNTANEGAFGAAEHWWEQTRHNRKWSLYSTASSKKYEFQAGQIDSKEGQCCLWLKHTASEG